MWREDVVQNGMIYFLFRITFDDYAKLLLNMLANLSNTPCGQKPIPYAT